MRKSPSPHALVEDTDLHLHQLGPGANAPWSAAPISHRAACKASPSKRSGWCVDAAAERRPPASNKTEADLRVTR
jgi:hypothetical protein